MESTSAHVQPEVPCKMTWRDFFVDDATVTTNDERLIDRASHLPAKTLVNQSNFIYTRDT